MPPTHSQLKRKDGTFSIGSCNDANKTIYINNQLTEYYTKKVLCHEMAHAAIFSYDIELTQKQEEIVVDLIATYGQEIIHNTNSAFKRIKRGA